MINTMTRRKSSQLRAEDPQGIRDEGEASFVYLQEESSTQADNPVIRDLHDQIGWVTDPEGLPHKKLLFVGDGTAGFRIYTYEEEQ